MARANASPVSFLGHLRLITGLRLNTAANRYRHRSGAVAGAAGIAAVIAIGSALGSGAYWVMSHPAVGDSPLWSSLLLRLFAFMVSTVFIAWPLLSAGVDEHSELSRFATFPISPLRLFTASSLSALVEPRALVFYPVIAGAALGFSRNYPVPAGPMAALLFAYALFNIAWGRAGLTLVLNVLRHRRSAEILGAVFIAFLFLPLLAPPADVAWLYQLMQKGVAIAQSAQQKLNLDAMHRGLGRIPPCALARGLEQASLGNSFGVWVYLGELLTFAAIGFALSYRLLLRFYAGTAKPAPPPRARRLLAPGRSRDGALWALIDREASDWLRNPKARLLIAVPFFLCILLRFSSARELAEALRGPAADVWLIVGLTSYAGLVVGANFAQNVFAYDGPGLALLYAAPVELRSVFAAKNLVHAGAALSVGLLLEAFYATYVHPITWGTALVGVVALAGQIPVLLAVGNTLSVIAPRKFHASLRRRDRPPALATALGLGSAALAVLPAGLAVQSLGRETPGAAPVIALAAVAAATWMLYLWALPRACALLESRRETVLRLIVRE
jgi:ABC-2 type transport system permease protein